tara:strand:+ start:8222 stop:10630 length:2409 start_codon:yes stop_codon:yes gene_type:complete
MKNKILIICFTIFFNTVLFGENLKINSKNITIDKNKEITIFENEVLIVEKNYTIKSDYAEYDRKKGIIKLKGNILATDDKKNKIQANFAEYNEKTKIFKSIGLTEINTSENYFLKGEDIILDNINQIILSDNKTIITDQDLNTISLENFEYMIKKNIFKSIGKVTIEDIKKNEYEFSQVYIDTKKKEILGTDIKAFLNDKNFKINESNKPRVFANTFKIDNEKKIFNKSIFTLCDYRKDDKCPPWTIQSSKMLHDSKKKTIYYDNALVKVYDIPIFYIPKLSHPDPTVKRRSGFLPPSLKYAKNLGTGVSIPYFFAVDDDKNFTFTNRLYATENPLFIGEYHQVFKNSDLLFDFGFTEGYKKTSSKKTPGNKSHFFSRFSKNFKSVRAEKESDNSFNLTVQNVSNDKYLKLYKIQSNLVDHNTSTLENSLSFTRENEDVFFGFNASIYETLNDDYNDKYEYILPEITIGKNLINNELFGNLDLQSVIQVHNYDTNKFNSFFVNDLNWNMKDLYFKSGIQGKLFSQIRNINYETRNEELYKDEPTNEIYGAFGYLTEINFQKQTNRGKHLLKPKIMLKFSPGSMRKERNGSRLDPINAYSLNRVDDSIKNFETGLSSTIGFDYKIKKDDQSFDFSVAQVISEKENKKMASITSLDEKISDLVGSASYDINENFSLRYNFSVDQSYKDVNYNEFGTTLNFDPVQFDFKYLHEDNHIGDQEYFKTKVDLAKNQNGLFSVETKRNLITNSSEFYNLSYEYLNDCLRAGIVFRREFYTDSELEPENSIMFKITLTPFGSINSPALSK